MAELKTPQGLVVGLIPDPSQLSKQEEPVKEDAPVKEQGNKRTGRQKADK